MTRKNVLWTAAAAVILGFYLLQARAEPGAKAAMQAGAKLLDVRTPAEFQAGHLLGAVNIPVDELSQRSSEVGAKDSAIVVYCQSGKRSARAKRILQGAGFKAVHDLGAMSNAK